MRWFVGVALATLFAAPAFAGTPERDKAWDSLIAEARKHGGEETQYKTSISYVFRKSSGEILTFTRMLDSPTRAVCVLNKEQNVTVCGNWDTGKLRYGWRTDADTPWSYGDTPPSEEKGSLLASVLAKLDEILGAGMKSSTHMRRD